MQAYVIHLKLKKKFIFIGEVVSEIDCLYDPTTSRGDQYWLDM